MAFPEKYRGKKRIESLSQLLANHRDVGVREYIGSIAKRGYIRVSNEFSACSTKFRTQGPFQTLLTPAKRILAGLTPWFCII